jgi:hypothetical protein
LQCESAFDGTDHRAEFDQDPVAGRVDDPPAMFGNKRVGCHTMLAKRLRRACLVLAHQQRIASDIGGEDRGKTAGGGHDRPSARFSRRD